MCIYIVAPIMPGANLVPRPHPPKEAKLGSGVFGLAESLHAGLLYLC